MVIIYLHFHKCAGTSIIKMFELAKKRFYQPNINGNPWNNNNIIEFWNYNKEQFSLFLNRLKKWKIEFIACEWNFLKEECLFNDIIFITTFRDPYDRLLSTYNYHGGDKKYKSIINWYNKKIFWERSWTKQKFCISINQSNYYTKMLNNLGNTYNKIIDDSHLTKAKRILEIFDDIIILENTKTFNTLYKYDITNTKIYKNKAPKYDINIPPNFKERFIIENNYDYKLYEYVINEFGK